MVCLDGYKLKRAQDWMHTGYICAFASQSKGAKPEKIIPREFQIKLRKNKDELKNDQSYLSDLVKRVNLGNN